MNIDKALAASDYQCGERTAEITWLAEQAASHRAIVEVGSWKGATTLALACNTPGVVYAVDTFEGSVGEEQHQRLGEHPADWLFGEFSRNTAGLQNLKVMRMTSLDASVKLSGVLVPEELRFDMIFLDASHDYDSVKADILAWFPLLTPGGLLCGHDRQWLGVAQALDELVPNYRVGVGAIWYRPC